MISSTVHHLLWLRRKSHTGYLSVLFSRSFNQPSMTCGKSSRSEYRGEKPYRNRNSWSSAGYACGRSSPYTTFVPGKYPAISVPKSP